MKNKILISKLYMLVIAVCLVLGKGLICHASSAFISDYNQTEYTDDEGFEAGDANCICQSISGFVWIGTDNGLYRYDGNQFDLFTMDSNTDGGLYKINCILATDEGMLYVGTENLGLFQYNNGIFEKVADAHAKGISTINNMYMDEDGIVWLATSTGVFSLENGMVEQLSTEYTNNQNILDISGYQNQLYMIVNGESIVTITDKTEVSVVDRTKYNVDELVCIYVNDAGTKYIGTAGRSLIKLKAGVVPEVINTGIASGINNIVGYSGKIWILSDEGASILNLKENGVAFVKNLAINEAMSDMMVDYEGNYWFTSYRKGILHLQHNKLSNLTTKYGLESSIVNCVTEYNKKIYIGTDDGLQIINDGKLDTEDELVKLLKGISIRDIYVDNEYQLWIGTYRVYGVIKVDRKGDFIQINRSNCNLVSNSINCISQLPDGRMVVGTEYGMSIIKDDAVEKNITRADGLENPNVISVYGDEEGNILFGTNGAGLYSLDSFGTLRSESYGEGSKFNIISVIKKGTNGVWIGTNNGLFYREGSIRHITSVDTSNSIYDIIIDEDGYMWIFGSKGVIKCLENDILSQTSPNITEYTKYDGILSGITELSTQYINKEGMVYVCCYEGLCALDNENVYKNEVPPRVRIASVAVDGKEYNFSELDGKITVPNKTNRITVKFSVLSYVNRPNIKVSYYLEGFENEPRTISASDVMEVEYTNLEGGNYTFVLSAQNSDGVECENNLSFVIEKELGFEETNTAKTLVVIGILLAIILALFIISVVAKGFKTKNIQVMELRKKSEQAEKSNRAKNDYVNYLSHEIRYPLNTILGVSEMILREADEEKDEQIDQYRALYESGHEILSMVDGISRLSNLKDDGIELNNKGYAVSDVIEELTDPFKSMINREIVDLKVSIEDKIPNGLVGDAERVKEIITNIYTRAASTTKEGYISINIDWRPYASNSSSDEKRVRTGEDIYLDFKITDTGIGVKEDRLDQLFELEDAYGKGDIGKFDVSLKLAIAKELVRLMDGEISAESVYGANTTISFSIRQTVFDNSYVNYNLNKKKSIARRNANSRMWLPDIKILVVDVSELGLQVEKTLFDTYGLTCDVANSGFDAIDKVMINQYDMVFMDTVMPVMDGKDTVREIRNLDGEEYRRMPIIAMSVSTVDMSREDILAAGFSEIIVKPVEIEDAETMFRRFLPEEKIKEKTTEMEENNDIVAYMEYAQVLRKYILVDDALKMMGGFDNFNAYIYNYKAQYQDEIDKLKTYIDEDVRKYKSVIHNLKSSSANICATAATRRAANLESAINIGNLQYAKDNTREFVNLMKNMFKTIDMYISFFAEENQAEDMESTVSEKQMLEHINRGKLKELRAFLKAGEKDPVMSLINDIDSYQYGEIDTEFFGALKATVADMDYEGASEIIDQYLNSI